MFDVKKRVIVITGGLGQLGMQFGKGLLSQGARVVFMDKNDPSGQEGNLFVQENAMFVQGDVTDKASLEAALFEITKTWKTPYGLINNAALDSPPSSSAADNGRFEDFPAEVWSQTMKVNVTGVFQSCQVFGGAMSKAGQGSIVNICSTYGLVSPDQRIYDYRRREGEEFYKPISYTASKSSLLGMTKYLATYWAKNGVRVNTMSLGGVFNKQDPRFLKNYEARVPLGRMAHKDEYNGAVVFLMSDAASYMTGSNMIIDGGWTAW